LNTRAKTHKDCLPAYLMFLEQQPLHPLSVQPRF
jgi:hypothetical protein